MEDPPILGPNPPEKIAIFAHKGCGVTTGIENGIEVNTLEAFQYAVDLGLEGFETDVSLSQDGEPIILHPSWKKTSLNDLKWSEIHKNQPDIPHLAELIIFLQMHPEMTCLLDIKQDNKYLVEKVVDWLRSANLLDRVYLTAPKVKVRWAGLMTDIAALEYARSLEPRVKIHVIDEFPFNINKLAEAAGGVDVISFGWLNDNLTSKVLYELIFHKKMLRQCIKLRDRTSVKIMSGITDTEKDIQRILTCTGGLVDIIQTDNPEVAVQFLRK